MGEYRFTLDRSSKKFKCPECGQRTFVLYIDKETGEYIPEQYGRCDREDNCSYNLNPYKDGYAKAIILQEHENNSTHRTQTNAHSRKELVKPQTFIPETVMMETLKGWEQNTFIQNLLHRVPYPMASNDIERVIGLYGIGTVCNGKMSGAVTFPFIDINMNIWTIQAKQFGKTNHTLKTDFLHSILEYDFKNKNLALPSWLETYLWNDKKVGCLFGEHLLKQYSKNPVALVEAPKTAVIGNLYFGFPDKSDSLLWLAVYNLSSLSYEKCKVLEGRRVILFPDLSKHGRAYLLWSKKAEEFNRTIPRTRFVVSNLLEKNANTEAREKGLDLADYLICQDWRSYRKESKR